MPPMVNFDQNGDAVNDKLLTQQKMGQKHNIPDMFKLSIKFKASQNLQ
jgi:hypothetical protein